MSKRYHSAAEVLAGDFNGLVMISRLNLDGKWVDQQTALSMCSSQIDVTIPPGGRNRVMHRISQKVLICMI
jgi:hypothetical protein